MDIGQSKRVQSLRDLFRQHAHTRVLKQYVERNARLSDANCTGLVNAQGQSIGV